MTAKTPKEQAKAPGKSRAPQSGEIDARELDKVVGGLKKSGGPKSSGVISDPCGGGE